MNKIKGYIQESYEELTHKTSWLSWAQLQKSAGVVAIASIIIALVIFGMDKLISGVLELVYDLFR